MCHREERQLMRRAIHSEFVGLRKGAEAPGKGGSMTTFFTESRKDRLIHERIHDPCKATCKPAEPSVCPVCFPRSSGRLDPSAPGRVISVVSECADAVRLGGKAKADCQRIQVPFCEVDPHYPRRFGYLCGRLDHSLQPGPTCQYGNLPPTSMRSPQRAKRT